MRSIKHQNVFLILLSISVAALDQVIKHVIRKMPVYEPVFAIGGIVEIAHYTNTGAAFSILRGRVSLIIIVSVLLAGGLLFYLTNNMKSTFGSKLALSLMIGGGVGNLLDRIVFGGVTDYIRLLFISFPVFNIADICITFSVITLTIYLITGRLDKDPEEC